MSAVSAEDNDQSNALIQHGSNGASRVIGRALDGLVNNENLRPRLERGRVMRSDGSHHSGGDAAMIWHHQHALHTEDTQSRKHPDHHANLL
jgi:hypothetical protein